MDRDAVVSGCVVGKGVRSCGCGFGIWVCPINVQFPFTFTFTLFASTDDKNYTII